RSFTAFRMTNVIRYDKNNCHSEGSATTEESLGLMRLAVKNKSAKTERSFTAFRMTDIVQDNK
ncbi:MAG: hypothetical protein J6K30_03610, partial [Oscillospiraceae bacterium]|nr:hypothetical protein [Oscillospiraceae bacterium]